MNLVNRKNQIGYSYLQIFIRIKKIWKWFNGIKMHPDYQKFYVDDKKMYKFYEIFSELDIFIHFDAGVDIGYPPPYHATPERIKNLIENFPN